MPRWLYACTPEPLEQLRYALAVIVWVLFFVALSELRGLGKWLSSSPAWSRAGMYAVGALVVFNLGYEHFRVHRYLGLMDFVRVAVLLLFWVTAARRFRIWEWRSPPSALVTWVLALALAALAMSRVWVRDAHLALEPAGVAYHLPFIVDEFAAAAGGHLPFVDFIPQYQSLLPWLLAPVWSFLGFSVSLSTWILAGLCWLGCISVYSALARNASSPPRALLLFICWLGLANFRMWSDAQGIETAFSYLPLAARLWLPLILVGCVGAEFRGKWPLLFSFAAIGAINSRDFGIPAMGGVLLAAMLFPGERIRRGLTGLVAFGLVFSLYALLIRASGGQWPDWNLAWLFHPIFLRAGVGMLPLPTFGLWWAVLMTFLAALVSALWLKKTELNRNRELAMTLVYVGIAGLGMFMYYIGRSHHEVLVGMFPFWGLALVLLVVAFARSGADVWRSPPVQLSGIVLGIGFLQFFAIPSPSVVWNRATVISAKEVRENRERVELIRRLTGSGGAAMMITPLGHVLAVKAGVRNEYPFAEEHSILTFEQLRMVLEAIERKKVRWIFGAIEPPELGAALERAGFKLQGAREPIPVWHR